MVTVFLLSAGCAGKITRETSLKELNRGVLSRKEQAQPIGDSILTEIKDGLIVEPTISAPAGSISGPPLILTNLKTSQPGTLIPLTLDISAVVAGHRARVVMDMVFRNPDPEEIAGILMVPLPDRTSPCYLSVFTDPVVLPQNQTEEIPSAGLLNPNPPPPETLLLRDIKPDRSWQTKGGTIDWGRENQAQVVESLPELESYEQAIRKNIEPALKGLSHFRKFYIRIPPMPGKSLKRIVFAYDQTLVSQKGTVAFTLPAKPSKETTTRLNVHEVGSSFIKSDLLVANNAVRSEKTTYGKRWTVPPSELNGEVLFKGLQRDPSLTILAGADPNINGTLLTLAITPDLPVKQNRIPTGRALFLVDTSRSAQNGLKALSGELLRSVLSTDTSLKEFAIICFDTRPALITPGFVANTPGAREHYLEMLESIQPEGATSFEALLKELHANDLYRKADTIFLFSDGNITWGSKDLNWIKNRFSDVLSMRWICYSFQSAVPDQKLLKALTQANGQIINVSQSQDLTETALAHRREAHRLDSVTSTSQDEIIYKGESRIIYPGEVILLGIRAKPTTTEIRLVLTIEGRTTEMNIPLFRHSLTDHLASRAWAEIYTEELLKRYGAEAGDAVFALSRYFSLNHERSSFIIFDTPVEDTQGHSRFNFRDILEITAGLRERAEIKSERLSGMEIPEYLDPERVKTIRSLAALPEVTVWKAPMEEETIWSPELLLSSPPETMEKDDPASIYNQALSLYRLSVIREPRPSEEAPAVSEAEETPPSSEKPRLIKPHPALFRTRALRTLTGVAENNPEDREILSLVGFTLLEWKFYDEAREIFSALRSKIPYEPQNWLLEAIALTVLGEAGSAALRYEEILARPFPRFGDYPGLVAERLYSDLLTAVIADNPDHPDKVLWESRLDELSTYGKSSIPSGRLILFWNLDKTDLDLYVKENAFSDVWYHRPQSPSGGTLFGDNTTGLGPEMYERRRLSCSGLDVFVDYYSFQYEPPSTGQPAAVPEIKGAPQPAAGNRTAGLPSGDQTVENNSTLTPPTTDAVDRTAEINATIPPPTAATLLTVFTRSRRDKLYHIGFYTTLLTGEEEGGKVPIISNWSRIK